MRSSRSAEGRWRERKMEGKGETGRNNNQYWLGEKIKQAEKLINIS